MESDPVGADELPTGAAHEGGGAGRLPEPGHAGDEPPPILGHWRRLYLLVLLNLMVLIVLFYVFTKSFE